MDYEKLHSLALEILDMDFNGKFSGLKYRAIFLKKISSEEFKKAFDNVNEISANPFFKFLSSAPFEMTVTFSSSWFDGTPEEEMNVAKMMNNAKNAMAVSSFLKLCEDVILMYNSVPIQTKRKIRAFTEEAQINFKSKVIEHLTLVLEGRHPQVLDPEQNNTFYDNYLEKRSYAVVKNYYSEFFEDAVIEMRPYEIGKKFGI